ncbi:hypothetical protein FQN57_003273 [Myotisia sp. PD_48]|nr:hypothetical protein FQN57_003273 [Myotisia sp. PD_48]
MSDPFSISSKRRRSASPTDSISSKRSGSDLGGKVSGSESAIIGLRGADNDSNSKLDVFECELGLQDSLPKITTDQEAIDEYEYWKVSTAAEKQSNNVTQRFQDRSWRKGSSSIYVDAFNLALECVLTDEAHLFNATEKALFDYWNNLCYESQYLYVRLFLRKVSSWYRVNRLGYYGDIADLPAAVSDLRKFRCLPLSDPEPNLSGLETPSGPILTDTFQFAEGMEQITTLEEASSLLLLDELKALAKEAKVQGRNKKELLKALHNASSNQMALKWSSSQTEEKRSPVLGTDDTKPTAANESTDGYFIKKILEQTGDCIRLSNATFKLFERVHMVFYRSTQWTEKSLTAIILAKISRRNYPEYIVSRSNAIFSSRSALIEFEAALRIQFELDKEMESGNIAMAEKLANIKQLSEAVYPRWKVLLQEEQSKEERVYDYGEGAYLRRFSPAWVYTRIIHKGLYPLGRFKEYKQEHDLLTELLEQRLFHAARRGAWYQRKALLEEHYMWTYMPPDTRTDDARKKEWKRKALRTCEEGLEDPNCHVIYHYDLQKRITKLEKALKLPRREQHDFSHVMLAKPIERTVNGIRIDKKDPIQSNSKSNGNKGISNKGRATVWVDEREGGECRVENMCLSWYRTQGWKGFHCEGGILRTLFGYLFYDVLFAYVPNVFQTPFQTCPLDLHTDSFYSARISEINRRLVEISNGEAERLIREVHARESEKQTTVIGIDWSFELEDLVEIASCFRGEALATLCKVMSQEYQQRCRGIPDLFLWRMDKKEVIFSEVKSENDRLSDAQRLWIHVMTGAGVTVELCYAVAREVRNS